MSKSNRVRYRDLTKNELTKYRAEVHKRHRQRILLGCVHQKLSLKEVIRRTNKEQKRLKEIEIRSAHRKGSLGEDQASILI